MAPVVPAVSPARARTSASAASNAGIGPREPRLFRLDEEERYAWRGFGRRCLVALLRMESSGDADGARRVEGLTTFWLCAAE
jgi:hypothetical protein